MRRIQQRIVAYVLPELAHAIVKRFGTNAPYIGDLGAQALLYMSLVDSDFHESERRDGMSFVSNLYQHQLLTSASYDKWMQLYKSQTQPLNVLVLFDWASTVPAVLWEKYQSHNKKLTNLNPNNSKFIQSQIVFMLSGISMVSYAFMYALVSDNKVHKKELEMLDKLLAKLDENATVLRLSIESKVSPATKNMLPTELNRCIREFIQCDILPKNLMSHLLIAYNSDNKQKTLDPLTSLLSILDDITEIDVACIQEVEYFNTPIKPSYVGMVKKAKSPSEETMFEQAKLPIEGTIEQKRFSLLEKDDLTVDTIDGITSLIDDDGERVEAAAQLHDMALDEFGVIRTTDYTDDIVVRVSVDAPKKWHELVELLAVIPQLTYQIIEDKIFNDIENVDIRLEAYRFVVQELRNKRIDIYETEDAPTQSKSLTIHQIKQLLLDIHKRFDKSVFASYSVNYDRLYMYHDLLSSGEERDLCMARYLLQQKQNEEMDANTQQQIEEMIADIRTIIINHNYRLVMRHASMYTVYAFQLEFMDLFQEGCIGLMIAVDKFDVTLNLRLSTYATWWIRQHIGRAIDEFDRTIRLPVHFLESIRRYKKIKREYEILHDNVQLSQFEVAKLMNITVSDVMKIEYWDQRITSLHQPIGFNSDGEVGDYIEDETDITSNAIHHILQAEINKILVQFAQREQTIIALRFGLNGNRPHTLEEIGKKLNITRERVRQIEKESLSKIRNEHHSLHDYLD